MLEIRPDCENCGKKLPNTSDEAMICSFECTFCKDCVNNVLHNVCPNCGGGFVNRPVRPKEKIATSPASAKEHVSPVDMEQFQSLLNKYKKIAPADR